MLPADVDSCFLRSPGQQDEFAGLSGSTPQDSISHHQAELAPAKDASLAAVVHQQLPEVGAAMPYVPQVLVRFCMS